MWFDESKHGTDGQMVGGVVAVRERYVQIYLGDFQGADTLEIGIFVQDVVNHVEHVVLLCLAVAFRLHGALLVGGPQSFRRAFLLVCWNLVCALYPLNAFNVWPTQWVYQPFFFFLILRRHCKGVCVEIPDEEHGRVFATSDVVIGPLWCFFFWSTNKTKIR